MTLRFLFLVALLPSCCFATLVRSYREVEMRSCIVCWHPWDYDSSNTRYNNLGMSQRGTNLWLVEDSIAAFRPTRALGNGYLYLTGGTGAYLSCPDTAQNSIVGDMDIRVDAALDSWTVGTLASKSHGALGMTWEFACVTDKLRLRLSTNGTSFIAASQPSTVGHGLSAFQRKVVRATVAQSGTNVVTTYYTGSDINNGPWTQIGALITNGPVSLAQLNDNGSMVTVGSITNAGDAKGKFYNFQLRSNVNGVVVASFDGTACGQTGYTDANSSPSTVWTINRPSGFRPAMMVTDTSSIWWNNASKSNYLYCTNGALLNFQNVTNVTLFALLRQHGTPGANYILNKRTTGANDAGYQLQWNSAIQPYSYIADGAANAKGHSSAPTASDHSLTFVCAEIDLSKMTNWTDGANGTLGVDRSSIGNTDNSYELNAFRSETKETAGFLTSECSGIGIANRKLSSKEQKHLKWELQSRGARNASSQTSVGFTLFSWPDGTNTTGTYPLVSTISNATVLTPNANEAVEADLATHKYHHHTRITTQAGVTFIAFSSAGSNEFQGGCQTAFCFSTNKGATWSAPVLACPSQSAWTNDYLVIGSRITYPRNFTLYNGTNYLIIAVDDVIDTGGTVNGAALLACAVNTNGTAGTLFRISSATCPSVDGKTVPSYDSTLGPPLMADSKIYGCWGGSYPNQPQSEWVGWVQYSGAKYDEPNTFSIDGSSANLYRLWRGPGSVIYQAKSTDSGASWTPPYWTSIPNSPSEMTGARLTGGQYALIGNPNEIAGKAFRDPLFLAMTSSNNCVVTNVWAIRQGLSDAPTYAGHAKQGGAQYPGVCQNGNYLYVSYSLQKESIGFSRVLIPGLPDNNNDQ